MMKRSLAALSLTVAAATQQIPDLSDLTFRNVGPSRGGRVTAVCGDATRTGTFYMGATGGGVWKTTNGGTTNGSLTATQQRQQPTNAARAEAIRCWGVGKFAPSSTQDWLHSKS